MERLESAEKSIREVVENQCRAFLGDLENALKAQNVQIAEVNDEIDKLKSVKRETEKPCTIPEYNRVGNGNSFHDCSDKIDQSEATQKDGHYDFDKTGQSGSIDLQNTESIEKESTFGSLINQSIESSTLHGFPRLVDTTIWVRILWVLAMAGAVTALSVQLAGLTRDYLAFDVTTDVSVKQGKMTFPAVTVCNNRPYLASRLSTLPLAENITRKYNGRLTMPQVLLLAYDELTLEDLSKLGASENNTIEVLALPNFANTKVEALPYHGSCYVIQPPPETEELLVVFNLHTNDSIHFSYLMDQFQVPGIKIYMKDSPLAYPTYQPLHEIDVSQSQQSLTSVTYDEINRLNGSFSKCQNDEDGFLARTGVAYDQEACEKECKLRNILTRCRCILRVEGHQPFWMKALSENPNLPRCTGHSISSNRCQLKAEQEKCDCKPKCHMKLFRRTDQKILENTGDCLMMPPYVCRAVKKWVAGNITKEWLRSEIVYAKILFRNQPYKVFSQKPGYPFLHFLSDIGGTMGLYLGASVLTYFELVQVGVSSWLFLFHKIKQKIWKRNA